MISFILLCLCCLFIAVDVLFVSRRVSVRPPEATGRDEKLHKKGVTKKTSGIWPHLNMTCSLWKHVLFTVLRLSGFAVSPLISVSVRCVCPGSPGSAATDLAFSV